MKRIIGKIFPVAAAVLACVAARGEEVRPETDGEIWNRGVDAYRDGNLTNALEIVRPLVLSRTHGDRASELAGAIEYSQGNLEAAAADMQSALRAKPEDERRNRNYTRAADGLPKAREEKHLQEVMERLGKQDPSALLGQGTKSVRAMMKELPEALTNEPKRAIALCERMSKRAEQLSDTWIVVKAGVAQSVTNEQQAMTITAQVEEARTATEAAAEALADMEPEAAEHLAKSETALTRFWKLTIMPPEACAEDMQAQTNRLLGVKEENGRNWQGEALDFTRAFRAKFPMWAQQYEQQAQSDTNKPPFTKEAQAEISALATEVEKEQIELAEKTELKGADRAVKELEVLKKLVRINELLPKDGKGGGQGQNQQNQDQKQDQQQDKQDQQQNQDQQNQNQDQQQDEQKPEDQKEEDQKEEDQKAAEAKEEEKKEDEQVEDVLRKAQERSDEHEADKKARMNKVPLPANERDW